MKRKIFEVVLCEDSNWEVVTPEETCSSSLHDAKTSAIKEGRNLARAHKPSQLIIHGRDGAPEAKFSFG